MRLGYLLSRIVLRDDSSTSGNSYDHWIHHLPYSDNIKAFGLRRSKQSSLHKPTEAVAGTIRRGLTSLDVLEQSLVIRKSLSGVPLVGSDQFTHKLAPHFD